MKIKYILGLFLLAFAFTSCEDPMSEIYDEIDAAKIDYVVSNLEITLTDKNYKDDMKLAYTNFSSSTPAENYIPAFLTKKYPALGKASRAKVTYNYYSSPVVDKTNAYTISGAEYDLMGQSYDNFENKTEAEFLIAKLLNNTYFSDIPKVMTVKYIYYTKNVTRYFKVNADNTTEEVSYTADAYKLADADYEAVSRTYHTFNDIADALNLIDNVATNLGHTLPKVYSAVIYKNYLDTYAVYETDGMTWTKMASTKPMTVEYLHNGTEWIVAPQLVFIESTKPHTIEYTLTNEDYELVGLGKYHNFSIGTGYPEDPMEVRIAHFTTILKNNFGADLKVGDVFLIHYNIYNGANAVYDIVLEVIEQ